MAILLSPPKSDPAIVGCNWKGVARLIPARAAASNSMLCRSCLRSLRRRLIVERLCTACIAACTRITPQVSETLHLCCPNTAECSGRRSCCRACKVYASLCASTRSERCLVHNSQHRSATMYLLPLVGLGHLLKRRMSCKQRRSQRANVFLCRVQPKALAINFHSLCTIPGC